MQLRGRALGGWMVDELLARGGMGEVWAARDAASGVPAAIKVVAPGAPAAVVAMLHAEIRTAATLSHPSIVQLYDAGELATDAGPRPWLAMERLSGGTLTEHAPTDWRSTRRILVDLLGALAHAHARGVLHRDLKPDNVMFDEGGTTRLVDFGIGVSLDDAGVVKPSGTPLWMPPEQFEAGMSQLGPWSDLYALGAVAWWMVTGSAPFAGDTHRELRRAQETAPLPALDVAFSAPRALRGWLERMLAKAPAERFQRAADARDALLALGAAPAGRALTRPPDPIARSVAPRLGLVRLRETPLVGRARELAILDALLDGDGPRIAVLAGPTGAGSSRLAQTVCRDVHESGVGTPFRAAHAPAAGDGLAGLVRRAARLDPDASSDAIRDRLTELGVPSPIAVAEIVRPTAGGAGGDLERRCALVADALAAIAADRLPVVWIDDAQWAAECVAFARHVAGRADRWLILATIRTDVPGDAASSGLPGTRVDVTPLGDGAAAELAGGLAELDPAVVDRVVAHTRGSPLFLVELVGEWITQGLRRCPDGFAPSDDSSAWPADLPALWNARLERNLADGDARKTLRILAISAALGADTDADELIAACAAAKVGAPGPVVARLLAERLATPDPTLGGRRWAFAHPSLREAVLHLAEERGLRRRAEWACAQVLTGLPNAERRAEHLVAAGDAEAAFDALLAARAWLIRRDIVAATRVTERAGALLAGIEAARGSPDTVRQGELAIARARVAVFAHDYARADAQAAFAMRSRDRRIRALGYLERGRVDRLRGLVDAALPELERAIDELRALGDREQLSVARGEYAIALYRAGRMDDADAAFADAASLTSDPIRSVELRALRASIRIDRRDYVGAIEQLDALEPELTAPDRLFPRTMWQYQRAIARAGVGALVGALADVEGAVRARYAMGSPAPGWIDLWADLLALDGRNAEVAGVLTAWNRTGTPFVLVVLAARRGDWDAVADGLAATRLDSHPTQQVLRDELIALAEAASRDDLAVAARKLGEKGD
jgi:tetratricopeptide (TPR) repeat protein